MGSLRTIARCSILRTSEFERGCFVFFGSLLPDFWDSVVLNHGLLRIAGSRKELGSRWDWGSRPVASGIPPRRNTWNQDVCG